jgi:hypothetical protein
MITKLKLILDELVRSLDPVSKARYNRKVWLQSVSLPYCNLNCAESRASYRPLTVHPLIDPYLTMNERMELLIRYGWVKHVGKSMLDDDLWLQMPRSTQYEVVGQYLQTQAFMAITTDEMRVSNTGEL